MILLLLKLKKKRLDLIKLEKISPTSVEVVISTGKVLNIPIPIGVKQGMYCIYSLHND